MAPYDEIAAELESRATSVSKRAWTVTIARAARLMRALSTALGNAAFIGAGLPIGLAIGSGLGARKDREAREAGRVLEVDAE